MAYSPLEKAIELKRNRRFKEALTIFNELIANGAKDAFLFSNLAHLYFLLKDYKQSLSMIEHSIAIKEPNAFVANLKAEILIQLNRDTEAEAWLHQSIQASMDKEAIKKLARLYLKNKRFEEALVYINRALDNCGYDRDIMLLKGEVLTKMGHKQEAEEVIKIIVAKDPKDEFAYQRLIMLKLEDKPSDEIIRELETIISVPSRAASARLRYLLANAYKEMKRYQDAICEYHEVLKLKPDYVFARKQLGFCLSKIKDYAGAIQVLSEVFAQEPEDTYVRSALISAYEKTGRQDEAKELLSNILSLRPDQKQLIGIMKKMSGKAEG
ncbi:MAG: tetratricopeptide repeat protein [Candidatus Desantisbacteria bacterium]|mgnify:FL=1